MREFDKPWVRVLTFLRSIDLYRMTTLGCFLDVFVDMPVPPVKVQIDIGMPSEFWYVCRGSASYLYIEYVRALVCCLDRYRYDIPWAITRGIRELKRTRAVGRSYHKVRCRYQVQVYLCTDSGRTKCRSSPVVEHYIMFS